MTEKTGKVCCNCRHCIRSKDEKFDIVFCRCDVMDVGLSYAEVMGSCCTKWKGKEK